MATSNGQLISTTLTDVIMANGSTFFGIHRTPLHYLVKCCNISSVRVEDVECSVINVKRTNGVEENVFFDPVRISHASTGDAQATINIAPDSCRFFSVFRHATAYEPPLLNGLNIPFDYRMLFNKSGVYKIIVCAHGKNTTGHSTIIEFQLNVSPNQDRNGKAYAEYHIPWVRQRAANSLGDGADAKS